MNTVKYEHMLYVLPYFNITIKIDVFGTKNIIIH